MSWQPIETAPEGVTVWTRIAKLGGADERNVQQLRRSGRLWFLADGSMYVYYDPTHWQPVVAGQPSPEGRP